MSLKLLEPVKYQTTNIKKANSSVNIVESRDSGEENVYINRTDTNS